MEEGELERKDVRKYREREETRERIPEVIHDFVAKLFGALLLSEILLYMRQALAANRLCSIDAAHEEGHSGDHEAKSTGPQNHDRHAQNLLRDIGGHDVAISHRDNGGHGEIEGSQILCADCTVSPPNIVRGSDVLRLVVVPAVRGAERGRHAPP